jgi:hypothetical protein
MAVTDRKIHPDAAIARARLSIALSPAASLTDRPFYTHRPGHGFRVVGLETFCAALAGAPEVNAVIGGDDLIITAAGLAIGTLPEDFQVVLSRYLVGGRIVEKAAENGIGFTAAHVITANLFGVVLIQIDNAGVVSTKVPLATQAYANAGLALQNLPAADAGKLAIGHIAIANNALDWVANTDDLTNGSDVTTAAFVTTAAVARVLSAARTFIAGERQAGALATALATLDGTETQNLVLLYTSGGGASLTNGMVTVVIRPSPLNGESVAPQ